MILCLGVLAVYLLGFLLCFLVVLFENDHKFGRGPNMIKFWLGLIVGFSWPILVGLGVYQYFNPRSRR